MNGNKLPLHGQRGVSLSGLIFVIAIVVVLALFGIKVIPTYTEYLSAKDGIAAAKATNGSTSEAKAAFYRHADVNAITSVTGEDIVVQKNNGQTEVSFDYDKVVPLFKNVHLVIRYAATTNPDGKIPDRPEAPPKK